MAMLFVAVNRKSNKTEIKVKCCVGNQTFNFGQRKCMISKL